MIGFYTPELTTDFLTLPEPSGVEWFRFFYLTGWVRDGR